jgi:hypothetical protein
MAAAPENPVERRDRVFLFGSMPSLRRNERPARTVIDPERPHELEARQPSQILGVPFHSSGLLDFWPAKGFWVLHHSIAEVIDSAAGAKRFQAAPAADAERTG